MPPEIGGFPDNDNLGCFTCILTLLGRAALASGRVAHIIILHHLRRFIRHEGGESLFDLCQLDVDNESPHNRILCMPL